MKSRSWIAVSLVCCASLSPLARAEGLDVPVPTNISTEYELSSGRLAKLPVSWYWTGSVALSGAHDVMFRAVCSAADSSIGRCDTGMLVNWGGYTLYNQNDPAPAQHGTGSGKGSFVDPPGQQGAVTYTVRVFSQLRATSRTTAAYSTDGGGSWLPLGGDEPKEVGGTVVRVGALQAQDFVEVQTRNNGLGDHDTSMVLFSPDNAPEQAVSFNDNRSQNDRDPRIVTAGSNWLRSSNYVLLGKVNRSSAMNSGVETRVDLIHAPLSVVGDVSRTACNGVCGARLEPGRYLLYVFASVEQPVGSYTSSAASQHPSSSMPDLDGKCPSGADSWYRGQPNDSALLLRLETLTANGWSGVRTRRIPRGAFGTLPNGGGWNKFAVPLEVAESGEYRLTVTEQVGGVTLFGHWRWERNPEASELKVVTFNTLYDSKDWNTNKYRNTANLLGTRGSILPDLLRVEERLDQARFQWEADIIGMQEVIKFGDTNTPDNGYTDVVRDELVLRSSLGWTYAQGRGETFDWGGAGNGPGMNPVFVSSNAFPTASASSIFFDAGAKAHAGCSDNGGRDYYTECYLGDHGDDGNYATAAKVAAWRGAGDDRPIAVFNVHMQASNGAADFAPRLGELDVLIQKIDRLLDADHRAFNRSSESDPDRSKPKCHQNRAILLGDWNVRAHECGEHYWFLRRLREHFGYAVDVSMSNLDFGGSVKQSMHVGDLAYGADDVPVGYQHMRVDDPRDPPAWEGWRKTHQHDFFSAFPWWAVDYRNKTASPDMPNERLSMIVLIGRGWAYDDPVLSYSVMSDSNHTSPMNLDGGGVEMWQSDCDSPGSVAADADGYAPTYPLDCGSTARGAPALHTDHRPMGVRLRIWSR